MALPRPDFATPDGIRSPRKARCTNFSNKYPTSQSNSPDGKIATFRFQHNRITKAHDERPLDCGGLTPLCGSPLDCGGSTPLCGLPLDCGGSTPLCVSFVSLCDLFPCIVLPGPVSLS